MFNGKLLESYRRWKSCKWSVLFEIYVKYIFTRAFGSRKIVDELNFSSLGPS